MLDDISDWVKDIAGKVHDLTRQPHALGRFHVMMKQWRATLDDQRAEQQKWRAKRKRYFQRLVKLPNDHPKRTQSDKPSEGGWTWEGDDFTPSPGARIFGWVPPELSHNAEPKVDLILPALDRENRIGGRSLRLDEKYTLLAAVHDYALMGIEKIDPWTWPNPVSSKEDVSAIKEAIPYTALLYGPGGELLEGIADAEHELRTFFADVETGLKAHAPQQSKGKVMAGTSARLRQIASALRQWGDMPADLVKRKGRDQANRAVLKTLAPAMDILGLLKECADRYGLDDWASGALNSLSHITSLHRRRSTDFTGDHRLWMMPMWSALADEIDRWADELDKADLKAPIPRQTEGGGTTENVKALLDIRAKCREWGEILRRNGWDSDKMAAANTPEAKVAELKVMSLIKKYRPHPGAPLRR